MKNLFKISVIILFLCPLFISAMEPEQKASDCEIYQFLSFTTKNDPELYLPNDLVHAIAITTCEITEKENIEITKALKALIDAKKGLKEFNLLDQTLITAETRALIIEEYKKITNSAGRYAARRIRNNPNLTAEIRALMKEDISLREQHNEQKSFTDDCSIQ